MQLRISLCARRFKMLPPSPRPLLRRPPHPSHRQRSPRRAMPSGLFPRLSPYVRRWAAVERFILPWLTSRRKVPRRALSTEPSRFRRNLHLRPPRERVLLCRERLPSARDSRCLPKLHGPLSPSGVRALLRFRNFPPGHRFTRRRVPPVRRAVRLCPRLTLWPRALPA